MINDVIILLSSLSAELLSQNLAFNLIIASISPCMLIPLVHPVLVQQDLRVANLSLSTAAGLNMCFILAVRKEAQAGRKKKKVKKLTILQQRVEASFIFPTH